MLNKYENVSSLEVCVEKGKEGSYISKNFYSAPITITSPFETENEVCMLIVMSSSPGLMEEDVQKHKIEVKENAKFVLTTQSFEKVHKSFEHPSKKDIEIKVLKNGYCKYIPQPVIPYGDSRYVCEFNVYLEDETAKCTIVDILTCGRADMGEKFKYKYFKVKTETFENDELIYSENINFEPDKFDMENFMMYEGYTHLANMLFFNLNIDDEKIQKARKLFESENFKGGVTKTGHGDVVVKVFGTNGYELVELSEKIIDIFEPENYRLV